MIGHSSRFRENDDLRYSKFLYQCKINMGQFSVWAKHNRRKLESWCYYKDLYGVNKVLLLLNEHGDSSLLFPNLSSVNKNNQLAKFEKNLSVGSISVEWP